MSATTFYRLIKKDRIVVKNKVTHKPCTACPKCQHLYCTIFAKRVSAMDVACKFGQKLIRKA